MIHLRIGFDVSIIKWCKGGISFDDSNPFRIHRLVTSAHLDIQEQYFSFTTLDNQDAMIEYHMNK